jgi:hypothetical protein
MQTLQCTFAFAFQVCTCTGALCSSTASARWCHSDLVQEKEKPGAMPITWRVGVAGTEREGARDGFREPAPKA